MNDWNIYIILLNCGYIIYLAAFLAKKIVWLRLLTITGNFLIVPYFLYFHETPLWNSFVWTCIYTVINLVMLFIIYLESRPVSLDDLEQRIYDRTFKSLEPRVFKKLIYHGSLEEIHPHRMNKPSRNLPSLSLSDSSHVRAPGRAGHGPRRSGAKSATPTTTWQSRRQQQQRRQGGGEAWRGAGGGE